MAGVKQNKILSLGGLGQCKRQRVNGTVFQRVINPLTPAVSPLTSNFRRETE